MAKDVITRFKLETTAFDSAIKQASKELSDYSKTATKAKEGFNQFTKANVDAARALGTMATSSNNLKGKLQELVGAYNEGVKAYKALSDEHKKSDWAQALAGSLTTLQQRIKDTKQEMQGLGDEMKKGGGLFGGGKLDGMLQVFGGNLMTKAAGFAASFASEIGSCVQQGIELARQGEGIRIAFERLGRGDILDGLREATHGTVTDIELMKAAVKFNDFKLPVEELGTMLAFAQQKAKDTGQSVDYMVDSIVTGLGRKSLMILDNLGLSASEIKDKMKDTGDMTKAVGAIIRDQMAKAGDYVETAADRAAQANVNMQNKMEELGRKFAPLQEASNSLWTSMKIGILDVIGGPLTDLLNKLTEAGRLRNALNSINGDGTKGNTQVANKLKQLQAAKNSGASQYILNTMQSGVVEGYNRQINEREQAIKDWKSWRSGNRSEGLQQRIGQWRDKYGTDVNSIKAEADAYRAMIVEYRKGAKDIMTPVTVDVKTDNATKPTNPTKTTKEDIQFADDSIMAQEKLIQELTQKWKTASGELRDGYLKDLEDAQQKLAEMTGKAKVKAQPVGMTFTAAQLEGMSFDNQIPTIRGNNGRAQDKLDLATAAFATGGISNIDFSTYISGIKNALSNANLGDELYNSMTEKLKDATTVSTLLQEMMERGLAGADLESTAQALKEKLLSPEGIDQTAIQSFLDTLNEQIEEAGGVGLKLNADTGEVTDDKGNGKNDGEELKKFNEGIGKLSGGMAQVTGGLKAVGVEIPKEVDQVLGVINGVSQIISGVGTIISIFGTTAITSNTTAVGLNTAAIGGLIAALEVNTATNFIPFLANGGIVPAFAGGGLIGRAAGGLMIPGNSMSGDRLRLPVDGGLGMIGVNSGELILNRAQQGNLASQLEGGVAAGANTQPFINGEMIYLGLQAYMRRSGLGEIVTSER